MTASIVRILLWLLGQIPLPIRAVLGRLAGHLFALIPTRDRRIAAMQLDLFVPERGGRRLLSRVYAGLGQTTLESINLKAFLRTPGRYITCPQMDLVEEIRRRNRPVLALTAHFANWDLLAAWTVSLGFELVTVGREAQSPALHAALTGIRESNGVYTIWRGDRSGLRELVARFQRPGVIAALIDQDTHVVSQSIPFFGLPARTPSSLVDLALKYRATILSTFLLRRGLQSYTVSVEEFSDGLTTPQILEQFNQRLEAHIRLAPEQWVWVHKRWRSPRADSRLSSREYIDYLQTLLNSAAAQPQGSVSL